VARAVGDDLLQPVRPALRVLPELDISQQDVGRACTAGEIARLMLALEAQGCHNVTSSRPATWYPR